MIRLLMIVSGARGGVRRLCASHPEYGGRCARDGERPIGGVCRQVLGTATSALGVAALLARDALTTSGGLAVAYGLALYNVLAGALII